MRHVSRHIAHRSANGFRTPCLGVALTAIGQQLSQAVQAGASVLPYSPQKLYSGPNLLLLTSLSLLSLLLLLLAAVGNAR